MPDKPSYLDLLKGISVAESQAHAYLSAWADVTANDELRGVLRMVAAREGEHGMSFAKRVNELGFQVDAGDDPHFAEQMTIACSDMPDVEKVDKLGLARFLGGGGLTFFDDVFKDHSIDIRTGELLGRYIAEEQDTIRTLEGCYGQLQCETTGTAGQTAAADLSGLEGKVDALTRAVEELRQVVGAKKKPAKASRNGA
jgi:rubrerythrin